MSSKAQSGFQSLKTHFLRRALPVAGTIALALGLGGSLGATSEPTARMPDGRPTPTLQPVPRWLTLKASEVRARSGPGLDYHILWEYHAAGLPVQVIAETLEWRKICDPEGSVVWVHRSVVRSRRSAYNATAQEIPIRSGRSDTALVRARLSPRSIVSLDDCEDGWCHVGGRKVHGWVPQNAVFGGATSALCDARRPAGVRPQSRG
ncbi:MAG TPA: SH3 domain-containing protein [Brevundimonas sp.]